MDFIDRFDQLFQDEKDKNHRLSRAQFADMIGASYDQVTGWYRGRSPDIDMLKRIAKRFDISVSWLVGETDIKYEPSKEFQQLTKGLTPEDMRQIKIFVGYLQHAKTIKSPKL